MTRQIHALLWSRKEIILANKAVVVNTLMPILMMLLYQFLFKGKEGSDYVILFSCLPMIPSFVGYILPTLVSEEAEKNNQRSLSLAGVQDWQYVVTSLFFPLVVSLVYLLVFPLYLKIGFDELGWTYFPVMIVTYVVVLLLFLLLSLFSQTQTKATLLAMPVMLVTSFLPMLSRTDEGVGKFTSWTFLGAFEDYSVQTLEYSLVDQSFLILIVWLVALVVGLLVMMRKRSKI